MKVVYLLGSLNRGGTETLMLDIFRNAERCGLDAVCIYRKRGVCEDDFNHSGVPMLYYPTRKNRVAYLIGLRRKLLQHNAAVVHAMQSIDALYAWIATRGTGIKVVLTMHCFDFDLSGSLRLIDSLVLRCIDLNIYVSNYQLKYYKDKYKLNNSKQKVNYNGVSFEKLDLIEQPDCSIRKEFGIAEHVLLLGMVGNFNSGRDHLTVCRFLDLLNESGMEFRFLFVGNKVKGQEHIYDECVKYCSKEGLSNRVIFTGGRKDVPAILKHLNGFLYSTAHDTFGIAVVEAMAAGIPVFVNDWGVMNEISRMGRYATIYKSGNATDLFNRFVDYFSTQAKNIPLEMIQKEVREQYSITQHIETLQSYYNEIIIRR